MKKSLFLLVFMVCLAAKGISGLKPAANNGSDKIAQVAPLYVIKAFLNWYETNRARLNQIHLIGGKPGDKQAYAVDFQETERYLKELKKSGLVSDIYLEHFREYFKKCDENLKRHPQYDGPAEGFGIDLVTGYQEYNVVFNHIDELKMVSQNIEGNKARVRARIKNYGNPIEIHATLTKSGNAWLIDVLKFE